MGQNGLGDAAVFVGEGPARAEADQHAAGADGDLGGGFGQALAPGAGEAFAQRIVLAAAVEPRVAVSSGEGFGGDVAVQVGQVDRDWTRGGSSQADEQVQRGGVQIESKEVGEEPMVAQAIGRQFALEFLVAVLTLAGHRRFGGPVYSS